MIAVSALVSSLVLVLCVVIVASTILPNLAAIMAALRKQ